MIKPSTNYIYVDGSYNPKNCTYGYGIIFVDDLGKRHILQGRGDDPELVRMRNVAGEILGAMNGIYAAYLYGLKWVNLYYDYDGIANWPLEKWKPRTQFTKEYANFVNDIMNVMCINFIHVKSHTGILENEEVDKLAKEAVGIWNSSKGGTQ